MTTTEFVAFTLGFAVLATCVFTAWTTRQARRERADDIDQALAVVAAKVTEEARPRFTPDEAATLADLDVRRRYAAPQDTSNATTLADEWRQIAPGVDDVTLGRLALAAYCTATAAWIGSPSGTWAMGRVTKALAYAAVELTELERSELPK